MDILFTYQMGIWDVGHFVLLQWFSIIRSHTLKNTGGSAQVTLTLGLLELEIINNFLSKVQSQ